MGLYGILDISAAGMDAQQARLAVAAANLANAQSTARPGAAGYTPLTVVVRSEPEVPASALASDTQEAGGADPVDALPRPVVTDTVPLAVAPRLLYNPGHPDADARGFVSLPGVDPITSMLDLISISRAYEAYLRAFAITRTLLQRTLDVENRR
jgi:flagellar basal-body rod protein FlgC